MFMSNSFKIHRFYVELYLIINKVKSINFMLYNSLMSIKKQKIA